MKMVRIQGLQIGLVVKHGGYERMLLPGSHWLWGSEEVHVYNQGTLLENPPVDLAVLLAIPEVAAALNVIEVGDNELALQYERNMFQRLLGRGRWVYWKGVREFNYRIFDLNQLDIPADVDLASLMPQPLGTFVRSFAVEGHEKGLLFIDWKFNRILDAGLYNWWKNNTPLHVLKVDMRQQQMEISGQEMLTKDKATLRVSFYVQYRVLDVLKAVVDNKDYDKQLYVLMQLALREYVGSLTLDELLEKKSSLADVILQTTAAKAEILGVELRGGGLRDVILPGDMKDIMNQVLMAEKKAQANIIMRREETASTRSLLNTAKLMEDNAMLWKLKEMEYVEKIADKVSSISVSGNGQLLDQLKQIFVVSR